MNAGRPSSPDVVLRPGSGDQVATEQAADDDGPLLDDVVAEGFRQRWSDVQAHFVDDPRAAVEEADALVAEVLQALAARCGLRAEGGPSRWRHSGEPGTEDLRLALQSYRSFFQRLLAA